MGNQKPVNSCWMGSACEGGERRALARVSMWRNVVSGRSRIEHQLGVWRGSRVWWRWRPESGDFAPRAHTRGTRHEPPSFHSKSSFVIAKVMSHLSARLAAPEEKMPSALQCRASTLPHKKPQYFPCAAGLPLNSINGPRKINRLCPLSSPIDLQSLPRRREKRRNRTEKKRRKADTAKSRIEKTKNERNHML